MEFVGTQSPKIVEETANQIAMDKIVIFDVPINLIRKNDVTHNVMNLLWQGARGWITGVNGHALNLAYKLPWMRNFYDQSLLNCTEGIGVNVAAWILGKKSPERIIWADWSDELFAAIAEQRFTVFLFGGTEEVSRKTHEKMISGYPGIRIKGRRNGFTDRLNEAELIKEINRAKPDILLVALGMPLQEKWLFENFANLKVKIAMPVGALFDYVSGLKRRSPRWMSSVGLEWLYRLFQEPKRLWRRYIIGNPLFVGRLLLVRWNGIFKGKQ
jgi:N-acetylglucosaminyldiphosphoundecaprenol N-acetyl-beta-D-mannosaminyltransferase